MKRTAREWTARTYARTAGLGYLIIIASGILSEFFFRGSLIMPGDSAATVQQIMTSPGLFRLSIAGDLVMLGCDVTVAAALYFLLRPVQQSLSLLAAGFRLVHAAVYGASLLALVAVVVMLGAPDIAAAFRPEQLQAVTGLLLELHAYGYAIGLVFFGLHCLILAYLVIRATFIPTLLGILLRLAAIGYLTDSFASILLLNYAELESVFAVVVFVPALMAELSFSLWLVTRGGRLPQTA